MRQARASFAVSGRRILATPRHVWAAYHRTLIDNWTGGSDGRHGTGEGGQGLEYAWSVVFNCCWQEGDARRGSDAPPAWWELSPAAQRRAEFADAAKNALVGPGGFECYDEATRTTSTARTGSLLRARHKGAAQPRHAVHSQPQAGKPLFA